MISILALGLSIFRKRAPARRLAAVTMRADHAVELDRELRARTFARHNGEDGVTVTYQPGRRAVACVQTANGFASLRDHRGPNHR